MWLSRIAVRQAVFTTMVVVTFMVLGLLGLDRLPVDLFPEVSLPVVSVIVPFPGASPAQVEEELVKPIEDAVAGLQGLDDIISQARENVGVVVVVFEMGTPIDEVTNELRDRIWSLKTFLPEGVDDPMIHRVDPAATPVLTFAVASNQDSLATRELAERTIKPLLERVDGVGAVNIQGGDVREIHLELDLPKLAELRIPLLQVAQIVGYDIIDIPGGDLEVGPSRVGLRSRGQVRSLDELGSIVLRGFPAPIYLRDVARVTEALADPTTLARVDGRRAVTLEVVKESGANTVAVCDDVREVAATMGLPAGVTLEPVVDTSDMVRDMLHEMQRSLVIGAAMAVLVIFLFMADWRSMLISGLALPTSLVTTFFFMWMADFSLNILSLIAMSLAVGVLIDDAVVVREVIFRHLEDGEDPYTSALKGTSEVALAVLATTLSILAVFVPVGFMKGIVGQFFGQFGLTIAIAVAISLFIAFTLDPMLSARMSRVVREHERDAVSRWLLSNMRSLDRAYRRLLAWSLDHPRTVLGAAAGLFALSLSMAAVQGFEFIPPYDRGLLEVEARVAPSSSLETSEAAAASIEAVIREAPEVSRIYTVVGPDQETDLIHMRVQTVPKGDRERSIYEIQDDLRERVRRLPGMNVSVRDPPLLEGAKMGSAIDVEVRGQDLAEIQQVADAVRLGMTRIKGAVNIQSTYRPGKPELSLDVDREKAAAAGLSVGQAGMLLRMAVAGQVLGKYRDGDRAWDIRLLARPEDRTPRVLLANLLLLSPLPRVDDPMGLGTPVALQDVARLTQETAPSTIERHDRQRHLTVSCSLADRPLSDVQADVEALLASTPIPPGVDARIEGMADIAGDALVDLLWALGLAIVFVYAVLASQFDSFIHPFTIMLSLPLAVVGAIATVFLMGWPIGILSMLGIILLMGLVTKNAILLVDRANELRAAGAGPKEAMLEAGHLRLRPILMTSLAMILGMVPPALSNGSGSELTRPMAVPVIGGLLASTLLTLVVVPVVYQGIEGWRDRRKAARLGRSLLHRPRPSTLDPEEEP